MYDLLAQLLANTQISIYLNASLTSNECTFDRGVYTFEFIGYTVSIHIKDTGFTFIHNILDEKLIEEGELLTVSQLEDMFPGDVEDED